MLKLVLFVLFLSILLKSTTQMPFECSVPEPSTRFMQLIPHPNRTELRVIKDGRRLDSSLTTYIVIHGWKEWPTKKANLEVAQAIAKSGNSNVLLMDFSKWTRKFYHCARHMVEAAGNSLAEFLLAAIKNNYILLDRVHLIGYSLGSHVSGLAGRIIFDQLNGTVHRITGLDAAGPLFTYPFTFNTQLSLRKTDAIVVDVLHTTSLIGTSMSLGTVDFFAESPYEGSIQPGCVNEVNIGCSHIISRKYYIESITSCGIKAEPYGKITPRELVTFGHHMQENTQGVYKFTPGQSPPYGKYSPECTDDTDTDD